MCIFCGTSLSDATVSYESRQVFDIPVIRLEVIEHRIAKKKCDCCGKSSKAHFPETVNRPTQYGDRLKALYVYLQNYQMLPYGRCAELIADLTNHSISTGSLSNFQRESFTALEDYEQVVKKQLLESPALHADETGLRFNGKNSWMHVISNKTLSFFAHHLKRGRQAMDVIGLLEHYKGTWYMTDLVVTLLISATIVYVMPIF